MKTMNLLGDVFKTLESEIDDDNAYLQLILFYSRSYVIPDIPSVDLLQKFHNSGKFVYDSIFFHEKLNTKVQEVFDILVILSNDREECLNFELSRATKRFSDAMCLFLTHNQCRCGNQNIFETF
ncbi:hypothetical protein HDU92_009162 [Lobulomyces angularis]|nr:hypothetical protein HDU92_009162 [Lobulomyces angularis]